MNRELTYDQLIDQVARTGAGLRAQGVSEGDRVALLIPNSVDFVIAALASMWIGATFVPLAVTDPPARLAALVKDSTPAFVLTSPGHDVSDALGDTTGIPIGDLLSASGTPMLDAPANTVAYMIYTSGTTGTPKGVQISSAAFAAAVRSTAHALGLSRSTVTLCISPFHFDGSYANLFPTLVSGGTVVIRPRESLLFPRTFFNTVSKEAITYSGFTPSYLRLLLASPQIASLRDSTLKVIALGGEALAPTDLHALWEHVPMLRVFNRYGPTETAIAVTNVELTPRMIEGGSVTFGAPHSGVSFALVDDDRRVIAEARRTGELYIGGVQLMSGYWQNLALTNSVMNADIVPGERMYKTGDLAYRDEQGNYFYVDRVDHIVKRSGVRISLVELSATISTLREVDAAACVTFDLDGRTGIVAFVTTTEQVSPLELRRASAHLLPENMLPDRFSIVEAMPLNASNQLDVPQLLLVADLRPLRAPPAETGAG